MLPALEGACRKLILLLHSRVYAVIASDGIWEFIDYSKVVDLTSKKLVPEMSCHGPVHSSTGLACMGLVHDHEPEQISRW